MTADFYFTIRLEGSACEMFRMIDGGGFESIAIGSRRFGAAAIDRVMEFAAQHAAPDPQPGGGEAKAPPDMTNDDFDFVIRIEGPDCRLFAAGRGYDLLATGSRRLGLAAISRAVEFATAAAFSTTHEFAEEAAIAVDLSKAKTSKSPKRRREKVAK